MAEPPDADVGLVVIVVAHDPELQADEAEWIRRGIAAARRDTQLEGDESGLDQRDLDG